MKTEQLIDIVNKFHDSNPDAKIFSVGIVDDNPDCVRLHCYTDNDGGHEDFISKGFHAGLYLTSPFQEV